GLQLDPLLDVGGQPLQDGVENTPRLAGRNHVAEEIVEDLRVLAEGVRQGAARFDVLPYLEQDLLERAVLLLGAQDLQALHQRKPRVEDRKSTRLNSSHVAISYAVFCLKKKKT